MLFDVLQCDHKVPKFETTWHAFSHLTGHTPKQLRDYMASFIAKDYHKQWIASVGKSFIKKKGLELNEYLENLISPKVPMDELGLLIMARMYHSHVAVIMYDWTWTSGFDLQPTQCHFVLAYCGGLHFLATCDRLASDMVDYKTFLRTIASGSGKDQQQPLDLSNKTKSNKKNHVNKHKKKQTCCRSRRLSSRTVSLPLAVKYISPRSTRTSQKPLVKLSLDSVLKSACKGRRAAAPVKLEEPDPIKKVLSDPSDIEGSKSDHESDYENTVPTKNIKTSDGKLSIQQHGIPKRVRKIKKITCPICDKVVFTQKKMNQHMKEDHPRFKFCCSYCQMRYDTYKGCYRHTQRHFKLKHVCDICQKECQYPGELHAHKRLHTKTGLYPCTYRGCTRKFVSKKSMWQHTQSHSGQKFECKQCDPNKSFTTYSYLRQHEKGAHSTGWRARCGHLCQWPHIRRAHQDKCKKCQAIEDEAKNKPDNPKPFTARKLTHLKDTST